MPEGKEVNSVFSPFVCRYKKLKGNERVINDAKTCGEKNMNFDDSGTISSRQKEANGKTRWQEKRPKRKEVSSSSNEPGYKVPGGKLKVRVGGSFIKSRGCRFNGHQACQLLNYVSAGKQHKDSGTTLN